MGRLSPALALLLAMLCAGCAAPRDHAAALARWRAFAPQHYILRTAEDVRGSRCGQIVAVRGEQLEQILSNTCRHPSLWTVSWLFRKAAPAGAPVEACVRSLRGLGCVCRQRVERQVTYDPQRGYPTRIRIVQTWHRAWADAGFWRALVALRAVPACVPATPDPGWTIVVRELRPIP